MKILVHITHGPENPTRAALGFLVAKTAVEQGHDVAVFLAGDGVLLMKDEVLDSLVGKGTGPLRNHFDVLAKSPARFYLSGMSSKARDVTLKDLEGKKGEFAMPEVLVQLAVSSERMFTY